MPEGANEAERYRVLLNDVADGRVVHFLGAGVNLCARPEQAGYIHGKNLPSGAELAGILARRFGYPEPNANDLLRVAQYVAVDRGPGPLYAELREVFHADYPPTAVHRFIASLPAHLRARGYADAASQVVVTTNYDDALERAFTEAQEPYDLVTYVAYGEDRGRFWHTPSGEKARLVDRPNEYRGLRVKERSVIVKIHGTVSREDQERDSYVITEDDYIDYSTRADVAKLLPVELVARLKNSHFLFLGYSLRDWNLRIIFHRIWGEQKLRWNSWAVQRDASPIDRKFWATRGVEMVNQDLGECVRLLQQACQALPEQVRAP
ncbi:MAG TPA: SIR2 family protein [Myxococcales bacterium]|nr:SIR2 family protein [Myxococcales bacterium]